MLRGNSSANQYPPDYEHLLECNGQTISEEEYPELVALLGTNVVPDLNGRVLQGSSTPNTFIEAGLPNIEGWILGDTYHDHVSEKASPSFWNSNGALSTGTIATESFIAAYDNTTAYQIATDVTFDASRSNAIYGNSDTVQPPAYTVKFYICYQS